LQTESTVRKILNRMGMGSYARNINKEMPGGGVLWGAKNKTH